MPRKRRWRAHRLDLYVQQGGKCYWCNCQMVLPRGGLPEDTANLCTVDHLRDRFDPKRSEPAYGEKRHVAACWTCNQRRCSESLIANSEEHKRRCLAGQDRASLTSSQPTAPSTQVMMT